MWGGGREHGAAALSGIDPRVVYRFTASLVPVLEAGRLIDAQAAGTSIARPAACTVCQPVVSASGPRCRARRADESVNVASTAAASAPTVVTCTPLSSRYAAGHPVHPASTRCAASVPIVADSPSLAGPVDGSITRRASGSVTTPGCSARAGVFAAPTGRTTPTRRRSPHRRAGTDHAAGTAKRRSSTSMRARRSGNGERFEVVGLPVHHTSRRAHTPIDPGATRSSHPRGAASDRAGPGWIRCPHALLPRRPVSGRRSRALRQRRLRSRAAHLPCATGNPVAPSAGFEPAHPAPEAVDCIYI